MPALIRSSEGRAQNQTGVFTGKLPSEESKRHCGKAGTQKGDDLRGKEVEEGGVAEGVQHLEEFGQGFDFGQIVFTPGRDAVVDVIMDQRPLRFGHRALDGVQLRGKIDARPPLLDHSDNPPQMPFGSFQPGGEGRVACMDMRF